MELTHFNEQGRAQMIDISDKQDTVRTAAAHSSIHVNREIWQQITEGKTAKGDVLAVAQVSGIMAAKQTSSIIPMCHPLMLSGTNLTFEWEIDELNDRYTIVIRAEVKTKGATGVEMEALTAASIAALTIYDMCKAVSKDMIIGPTYLLSKTGGKSGNYKHDFVTND